MVNDGNERFFTKVLIRKLIENRKYVNYELIEECFNEDMKCGDVSMTLDQIVEFTDSFTRDLNVVTYHLKEKLQNQGTQKTRYKIYETELTRNCYSIRTEAPQILGESAQTLNTRVNEGIIKCLPEFSTKKVSAEELYNYYVKYLKK